MIKQSIVSSIYLSIYLYIYLYIYLSIYLPIYLSIYLSIDLSIYLSNLYISLSLTHTHTLMFWPFSAALPRKNVSFLTVGPWQQQNKQSSSPKYWTGQLGQTQMIAAYLHMCISVAFFISIIFRSISLFLCMFVFSIIIYQIKCTDAKDHLQSTHLLRFLVLQTLFVGLVLDREMQKRDGGRDCLLGLATH